MITTTRNKTQRRLSSTAFYAQALGGIHSAIWQETPYRDEYVDAAFTEAVMSFYRSSRYDIEVRRDVIFSYVKYYYDYVKAHSPVRRLKESIPVTSFVPFALSKIYTAYTPPPERVFSETNQVVQEAMSAFYTAAEANARMKEAERMSGLCGVVAVRPVVYSSSQRKEFQLFTPDQFRVELDEEDNLFVTAITVLHTIANDKYEFRRWTSDVVEYYDEAWHLKAVEEHPYGRVPFAFMRANGGQYFYGDANWEIFEANLIEAEYKFTADQSAMLQSSGILLGINTGVTPDKFTASPGAMLNVEGVLEGEGQLAYPDLRYITPSPMFTELDTVREARRAEALTLLGIPANEAKGSVTVQSGVARLIEREGLLEVREDSLAELRPFESDLAALVSIVMTTDMRQPVAFDPTGFSVRFQEQKTITDPKEEYELDKQKVADGVLSELEFYRRYSGNENADEADMMAARADAQDAQQAQEPQQQDQQQQNPQGVDNVNNQ